MSTQTRTFRDPGRLTPRFLRSFFGAPHDASIKVEHDGEQFMHTVTWHELPPTGLVGRHRRRYFGGR